MLERICCIISRKSCIMSDVITFTESILYNKERMTGISFDENFLNDIYNMANPYSCVTVFGKP